MKDLWAKLIGNLVEDLHYVDENHLSIRLKLSLSGGR